MVSIFNQQGLFQVPYSVLCDSLGVANSFGARFLDVQARWLFAREISRASATLMDVVYLRGATASTYNNYVFTSNNRYKCFVASCEGFGTGAEEKRVLIQE